MNASLQQNGNAVRRTELLYHMAIPHTTKMFFIVYCLQKQNSRGRQLSAGSLPLSYILFLFIDSVRLVGPFGVISLSVNLSHTANFVVVTSSFLQTLAVRERNGLRVLRHIVRFGSIAAFSLCFCKPGIYPPCSCRSFPGYFDSLFCLC